MKNGGRKAWVLLLVLLAGVLIGGVVWQLLLTILPANMNVGFPIGTGSPLTVNLYIIEFTIGLKLIINPGSAAGLIAGLAFFFWRR